MGKVSVIIYITVALLFLLLISQSPKRSSNHNHRGLKIRSTFSFLSSSSDKHHEHNLAFDPLIADIERRQEDKEWGKRYFEHNRKEFVDAPAEESQPELEDFMNAEDYLNVKHRFNFTNMLVLLFLKIDVDQIDGFISEAELTEWNLRQAQKDVLHRTEMDMERHDKNHDGLVSFAEYEAPRWARHSDNDTFDYDMDWWKEEHFNASDTDGDGLLNRTEFNDFLHPADSNNLKLLHWLCKEVVRVRDTDKDGKLNFKEFFHGLFDLVRNYVESHNSSHHSDASMEAPAKILFRQLDQDGDGYLSDTELILIIGNLHSSERKYAKWQADYTISLADMDKDGRLSLAEMTENPHVFYDFNFKEEDDYEYHDEFR